MTAATLERDLLRIVVCGSVDDGKSTLIGRLLGETGSVPEDQLASLAALSRRYGSVGDEIDYALLLDGLESEREQGITIDVAYRYFGTPARSFVVADVPGHEQYTRNMVTGASGAELAVLLVDIQHGLTVQTMRHSRIAALMGIRRVLLAVNKMDLANYSNDAFAELAASYREFAAPLGFEDVVAVPVAARHGDNIVRKSVHMPWHDGPTVLSYLEKVKIERPAAAAPFRFLVQSVQRDGERRGYAGLVSSGSLSRGDEVRVAVSGQISRIDRIGTLDGDLDGAATGHAVTLYLEDERDIGRGDILADPASPPEVADQLAAHVVWLDDNPLLPGRNYWLRIGTQMIPATVTALKHKVDVKSGMTTAGRTLQTHEIGFCNLATTGLVAFDPYAKHRGTGAFILIDRMSAATVGAGVIAFGLRRASNIKHQDFEIDKGARASMKGHRAGVVWFTGLPGAGKSTIMNLVEQRLQARAIHTYALDGDNLRRGLNRDLGFTDVDRVENIRRAGEVAGLMVDAGLLVLCAFVSPFRADRDMARKMVSAGEFIEVFVDTPLQICEDRDPKGLYAKARSGQVAHVTGVDSPYEAPETPELRLLTTEHSAHELANRVLEILEERGIIPRS